MERLIKADALIENIEAGSRKLPANGMYFFTEQEIIDIIQKQPTADAVNVVFCRNCRRFDATPGMLEAYGMKAHYDGTCPLMDPGYVNGDDFCSYGKRRAD